MTISSSATLHWVPSIIIALKYETRNSKPEIHPPEAGKNPKLKRDKFQKGRLAPVRIHFF